MNLFLSILSYTSEIIKTSGRSAAGTLLLLGACAVLMAFSLDMEVNPAEQISNDLFQNIHSNPSKAREMAFDLLESINEEEVITRIDILRHIGTSYGFESNFSEALAYYSTALSRAMEINSIVQIADINNSIGVVNSSVGNFNNALIHFTEALSYYEELGDEEKKNKTINNIGLLFLDLENVEKAREYFEQAFHGAVMAKDTIGMSLVLNNISSTYAHNQEYEMALTYLERSVLLARKIDNQYGLCIAFSLKGEIFLSVNQQESAINCFTTSREIAEKINHPYHYANACLGISKALLYSGKYQEALSIAMKVMAMASDINSPILEKETHRVISGIYKNTEDTGKSLMHFEEYVRIKDKLLSQTIIHQIYDFELKSLSQANKLQQLEIERKELAISKKNNLLFFSILISVFIITGLYLIYLNHRNRQRVKLQQTIIQLTEKKSHAAIEAEIQERRRIGQELHDSLGHLLSVAALHISVLQNKKNMPEERKDVLLDTAMKSVGEAYVEVRNISHNLAPSLLSERGLEGALKTLSDQVNQTKQIKMEFQTFGLKGKLNDLVENTLFRAIQEIINNTIKHSNASCLNIQVAQGSTEITLMAEDNGSGFDKNNVTTDGCGLSHMRSRIENLNGSLHVDSTPSRGTIISIEIPLNPAINVRKTYQCTGS